MMTKYIDAEKFLKDQIHRCGCVPLVGSCTMDNEILRDILEQTPAADVVDVEKYNDLREAFVDFVCSGVHNPAPYCKNSCNECVDSRGFCTYNRCNGFNPDGRKYEKIY